MPYRINQYVKARLEGWYGQVTAVNPPRYTVRIGGTDTTKVLEEGYLEPMIVSNPLNLSLVKVVTNGGAILNPQFAYPFTNESGLGAGKGIWRHLSGLRLTPGAFVGVSGGLLDFACKERDVCRQIVCADINILTVDAIDDLRALNVLLNQLSPAGRCGSTPCSRPELLTAVINGCRDYPRTKPEEMLREYSFEPAEVWLQTVAQLLRFAPRCYGKFMYSSWYQDATSIPFLAEKIAAERFSLLCGDLHNQIFQKAILAALLEPVTLFNFSNVIDYVTNPKVIVDLFSTLPHTDNAVVVTSSRDDDLQEVLGSFEKPGVLPWAEFIGILKSAEHQKNFGNIPM